MRRPRHSGSVFQPKYRTKDKKLQKSRTWWIRWTDREHVRHKEPTVAKTKGEAETILRDKLRARDLGQTKVAALTTLEDLRAMLVADYQANGRRTLPKVKQTFAQILRAFGENVPAASVTSDKVTAYVAKRLEDGGKPATVNRELAALRRAFRLALRAGKVATRPDFSLLTERNVRQGFVEREQLDAILAHLPEEVRGPVLVAYITGWRMHSEVLTRQWRHVDMAAGGWLRLDPGDAKDFKSGRMFPLTAELRTVLENQRQHTDEAERELGQIIPWVFHRWGVPIHYLRRSWKTACRKAGLPGRLIHDLRRSAVRNMERAGVPRSAAMAMVGHKTQSVYARYSVVDEAMLREAAAKLEPSLGRGNSRGQGRARRLPTRR